MKMKNLLFSFLLLFSLSLSGCMTTSQDTRNGTRDNTPNVKIPEASGTKTIGNSKVTIDISNSHEGYVIVKYEGDNPKVKVKIQNPNGDDPYIYTLKKTQNVFPLTGRDGRYSFYVYENVYNDEYSQLFYQSVDIKIKNLYTPYLYPNQYVNFNKDSLTVKKGKEIASKADDDLDVVTDVYNYVVKNISYDDEKAQKIKDGKITDYIPDVDQILKIQKGICFDYAAVMATMLRSQRIPTRMMIGYVTIDGNSIYHAWIGVYIEEIGWVDDFIEFDGKNWSIMDPTIISDNNNSKIKDFVKNQDNYLVKYLY